MTKEQKEKAKKTREENNKKILEICGYEVWVDPMNYTVVKDGKNSYFATIQWALADIASELRKDNLPEQNDLKVAVQSIIDSDKMVIEAISKSLAHLGSTKNVRIR